MELQDKKVLVVGSGKSGIGASRLLGKKGALPVLFDSNEKLDKKELMEKTGDIPGLTLWVGTLPEEVKSDISLVVIRPGVPAGIEIYLYGGRLNWPMPLQREK